MEQSREQRIDRLLQISADLHNRFAEVQSLRRAVREAEANQRGREPIHPAVVAPSPGIELRYSAR
jgi:hypothetical protein